MGDRFQFVAPNGTAPPTVATAASAILAGNQASAGLSVLGASQYGASTLTYTWATIGTPPAPVSFSTNGNNSASNVTARFTRIGNYNFQVTITDPAGNAATSGTSVTVSQVVTMLTVSPHSGAVAPNGTLQFTDKARDQFGNPYAAAVSWTVSGGGTIDSTGKFTAGSVTGGPFTVTASAGTLSATATVTISNNVNLALDGTAYRWWNLGSSTSNANRAAAPGLNDGNLSDNVVLSGSGTDGQGDDNKNAYEAGGIIWGAGQSITRVTFTNGSFSPTYDGVFDANFGLQVTMDGTTWTTVSAWTFTPAYAYDTAAAASKTYTFTGPALNVLGARVVGQVHTSDVGNNSWYDTATEVQAFGPPARAAATYRFGDLSGNATPVNAIPGGMNFGTGEWLSDAGRLSPSGVGYFAGAGAASTSFTLPAGQLPSAIPVAGSNAGMDTIGDGVNAPVSDHAKTNPPGVKATRATRPIALSTGADDVIGDILYD